MKNEIEKYLREGINFNNVLHNKLEDDSKVKDWFLKATGLYSSDSEIKRPIIFTPLDKIDAKYEYQSKFEYLYIRKFYKSYANYCELLNTIEFQINGTVTLTKTELISPKYFDITDITRAQFKDDNKILFNYDKQNN